MAWNTCVMADLMENTASPLTVEELFRQGLLSAEARDAAHRLVRPQVAWSRWTARWLLAVGAVLTLTGIVCLIAFNWNDLGTVLKLGGAQVLILACALGAWRVGLERFPGKILLTSASFLVGVALALYGQIYQTGADTYELFLGWAALVSAWVLMGRFAALWFLWLVLLNLAVGFYWEAHDRTFLFLSCDQLALTDLSLAVLNLFALVAREWAVVRGVGYLQERWLRIVLVLAVLGALFVPSVMLIVEPGRAEVWVWAGAALNVAAMAAGFLIYRRHWPDIGVLSLFALDLSMLVMGLVAKLIFDGPTHTSWELGALVMAVLVLVIFGGTALWLRNVHREMKQGTLTTEVRHE